MNAADAFVAALRQGGVTTLFGLPGSTEAALLSAVGSQGGGPERGGPERGGPEGGGPGGSEGGLRYVLGLHEGIVVSMADGYARVSGGPAVVGLHTSVGTMNGLSQTFNAYRDHSPVVVTAGHKDRAVLDEDGFCAFADLASLPRSFAKWSWQSLSAGAVAGDLRRALHLAMAPPRGPVYLAVPEDLMREELPAGPQAPAGEWADPVRA
ncbi:MAG: thiamine pyrophosphate-binding protein, partial [Acidimicrobiales bacterium]